MRRPLWTLSCAALLIAGVALLASDAPGLTAAVIGAKPFSYLSVLGLSLIAIGGLAAGLEDKLARHEDARVRRDLLQEHLRTNGNPLPRYNTQRTHGQNVDTLLASHYAQAPEIVHCFERYLYEQRRDTHKDLLTELATPEFQEFRRRASELISRWDRMAAYGQLVPIAIVSEGPARNERYQGMNSRVVFFTQREDRDKWLGASRDKLDKARKSGAVIAAHEIINPAAIAEPDKLSAAGEIHWELDNILRDKYAPIGGPITYGKGRPRYNRTEPYLLPN